MGLILTIGLSNIQFVRRTFFKIMRNWLLSKIELNWAIIFLTEPISPKILAPHRTTFVLVLNIKEEGVLNKFTFS